MISFKGAYYPELVIMQAVFFYVRFGVSYRDLEEITAEHGVSVDHATLNRWVVRYAHEIARAAQKRKARTAVSWRMDEIYVKAGGEWIYLYGAVDRDGQTPDFMLSKKRDTKTAKAFFANGLYNNGIAKRIMIDKSRSNAVWIKEIDKIFKRLGKTFKIHALDPNT